ncbi:hypothetical protein ACLOAV_002748 [Pseudogymnoascus australis]
MSARRVTPAGKQRVRTGCLTCRRRRRKCDEQKPRCENCEAKGFSCRYGADLSFVSVSNPRLQQSNGPLNATVQGYSTITFVDDDDAPLASTPPERDEGILCQHTPAREVENDTATALDVGIAQRSIDGPAPQQGNNSRATSTAPVDVTSYPVRCPLVHSDSLEQSIPLNTLNHLINDSRRALTCRTLNNSHNRTYSESTFSNRPVDRQGLTNGVQETGLLRHFRYNLAPWIDVGDPGCFFGIKVMLLATANRSLLAALLALAARHRSLIYPPQNSGDLESSLKFREEAERGLVFEDDHILEIRGAEADQIGTHNPHSFPILIYTTPLALASNAAYHITSLLMLAHKPRLLKRLAGPGCFTSHIWHAQSIAGIATSNDSLEQWDPILVAGLLLMAKEMTHESQQSVLLDQLGRVTSMIGIKLEREIEALKSGWNISRYNQDTWHRQETVI